MASAQLEQSRVLQEELTCPVCLDLYRDPHLLPCGHNFCKTCLDHLKQQSERGRFRCPECRDNHRCGTAFQKNFKLANIADDYRHRRKATTSAPAALKSRELLPSSLAAPQVRCLFAVPCDYCPTVTAVASHISDGRGGSSTASVSQKGEGKQEAAATAPMFAVKTCLKCEVSMCQEHVKPHLELPVFCEHPLTEPINDFWKRKCPYHDEIYRYYCMDDKVCVCNACTIEGEHSGHTMKTLKNAMKDLKVTLDKQLYRVERKYSMAEKKLQEQKEKERQNKVATANAFGNWWYHLKFLRLIFCSLGFSGFSCFEYTVLKKLNVEMMTTCNKYPVIFHLFPRIIILLKKFMDDSEQCLTRLGDEMKGKVLGFIMRLQECTRTHCDTNGPAIQKNIFKIGQDQARLQEVRCGIESLMQENDPFRFIEAYKTTGKQCRRQLRKNMFYPEYVDMETEVLVAMMEEEMRKFLDDELPCHIVASIHSLCHLSDVEEEEEQEENEEEAAEEDDEDLDDSSEEEMRSDGEDEEDEEEDEGHDQSDLGDDLYSPGEEDEDEEEEEDNDEDGEEEDEEERGV
ncbi:E3 ubiquitin/ISG15 ligase TRIM25 [Channa argus]|uniref:E3 ubiquitin/ISG15 ligase TRIM25 n=1 Tax=Channa argus TaxID=215402 RepID=A0A6G1Q5M2_CHAAH|nr:E3 ubiquitin/ISG15 ligase TRIM25 [Channa argus]